jgi:hypothetical protein
MRARDGGAHGGNTGQDDAKCHDPKNDGTRIMIQCDDAYEKGCWKDAE